MVPIPEKAVIGERLESGWGECRFRPTSRHWVVGSYDCSTQCCRRSELGQFMPAKENFRCIAEVQIDEISGSETPSWRMLPDYVGTLTNPRR
jgi:hypothetical protein